MIPPQLLLICFNLSDEMSTNPRTPEGAAVVEDFFGVYLLYCTNPRFKGRTYIGYTVNPNRRISQHNRGSHAGGARRTSNKGPWEMVLIIHGFPNDISALRFEWAWQHPKSSRRLNGLPGKKSRERSYDYCLRLLASMLNLGPWNKLGLTVRWLKPEFQVDFPPSLQPPLHMPLVYGPVKSKSVRRAEGGERSLGGSKRCNVCHLTVSEAEQVTCLYPSCQAVSHVICLAETFTAHTDSVLPVLGQCPTCRGEELWADIIRKRRGCYQNLEEEEELPDD